MSMSTEIGRKRVSLEYITFHYSDNSEMNEHRNQMQSEGWTYESQFERTCTYTREIQLVDKEKLINALRGRLEPAFHEEMLAIEKVIREIENGEYDATK